MPKRQEAPIAVTIGSDAPAAATEGDAAKPKKRSKWDDVGDLSAGLPDWLKDLAAEKEQKAQMAKSAHPTPPGIDPSKFKLLRMEGIQIRALIGKGGETIKDIRARSGADIKIDHVPSEKEGNVTIVGDVEKVEAMIKETLASKGCPLGMPAPKLGAVPGALPLPAGSLPSPAGPGGLPLPGLPGAGTTPADESQILIPGHLVGPLIGPGGASIKAIREKAGGGVFISILPAATPGADQIIRVCGENRGPAVMIVNERVDELRASYGDSLLPGGCLGAPKAPSAGGCPQASVPQVVKHDGRFAAALGCGGGGTGPAAPGMGGPRVPAPLPIGAAVSTIPPGGLPPGPVGGGLPPGSVTGRGLGPSGAPGIMPISAKPSSPAGPPPGTSGPRVIMPPRGFGGCQNLPQGPGDTSLGVGLRAPLGSAMVPRPKAPSQLLRPDGNYNAGTLPGNSQSEFASADSQFDPNSAAFGVFSGPSSGCGSTGPATSPAGPGGFGEMMSLSQAAQVAEAGLHMSVAKPKFGGGGPVLIPPPGYVGPPPQVGSSAMQQDVAMAPPLQQDIGMQPSLQDVSMPPGPPNFPQVDGGMLPPGPPGPPDFAQVGGGMLPPGPPDFAQMGEPPGPPDEPQAGFMPPM